MKLSKNSLNTCYQKHCAYWTAAIFVSIAMAMKIKMSFANKHKPFGSVCFGVLRQLHFRIIATLALSFVFYIGSSQVKYHRLYETTLNDQSGMNDTIFYHMSSTTISGDVYAMGTKRVLDNTTGYEDLSVIFTKHNDKGNIDWSKELDLGQDTVKFLGLSSIGDFAFNGTQDSILFAIEVEINGNRSELFGKLDAGGNEIDLKTVGGLPFSVLSGNPKVSPFVNQSDLLLTSGIRPTISRIGLGDDLIWSLSYEFLNTSGDTSLRSISDITTTVDSTIVLCGFGDGLGREFVVAELDSNGIQLWAESYTFNVNNLATISPTVVEPLSNGNFAVAGSYFITNSAANGFVAIIDSVGSILMTKRLYVSEVSTFISDLIEGADGTLWMSGSSIILDTTRYFTANMNFDGTVNWTTIYPEQEAELGSSATSLLGVQSTGGATLIGHGFLDDLPVMQVMKHDPAGETPCSDTIPIIVEDLMVVDDTLTSSVANGGIFLDSIDFELNTFLGFNVPVLTITDYPPFCPNEFIDTFLVASVDAVADENKFYLWSTGETTDTIRIVVQPMMMPQYSVTVTITEDVCYTMCDTVEIARLTLPQVAITQDLSRYCDEKIIVLNAAYTQGAENETYLWSTGETTQSIEVTQAGPYRVTVIDECGEMADTEIEVVLPGSLVTISDGPCMDGQVNLIANFNGIGNMPQFTWSTNETTNNIFVNSEGLYSVTATDECDGTPAIAEINYQFPDDLTLGIDEVNTFTSVCTQGGHLLSALLEPQANMATASFIWSTGESGFQIVAPSSGTYIVTATSICGQVQVESIDVDVKEKPTSGEITFELICDEENNALSRVIFDATTNVENPLVKLDVVNAEDNSITISQNVIPTDPLQLGNYYAVLSTCEFEELATLTVNAAALCGGLIQYPIAFFPSGEDEDSKTFGPIPTDSLSVADLISDVEFKVFNRWGETVFESNDLLDAWDGSHKGDPAPSEVYIWYMSYIVEGVQMLDKGDVTLIR